MIQFIKILIFGWAACTLCACSGGGDPEPGDIVVPPTPGPDPTPDPDPDLDPQEITDIKVIAPDFYLSKGSRLVSDRTDQGFTFTWENQDTLGIVPSRGTQAAFPIEEADIKQPNIATFTGGGWALKPSSTYAAYYPYQGNDHLSKARIAMNYTGQWQKANADYSHLSRYVYMAAQATTPVNGAVTVEMQHLGCYTVFEINTPEPTSFSSVTFRTDQPVFVHEARLNLSQPQLSLEPVRTSDSITFSLEGVQTTAQNLKATLAFMFAPVNLAGKTVQAILRDTEGAEEIVEFSGQNMLQGQAYVYGDLHYVTYPKVEKPNWNFDKLNNPYQIGMSAIVSLPQSLRKHMGEGDEMAAFINGELRGVGSLSYGNYYLFIYGNFSERGKVTFRYFNQKKSYLYEAKDLIDFDPDRIFGVADAPEELPLVMVR